MQGAVRISLQYFPLGLQEADSSRTIATYFPPREEGNRVTLYQCADTPQLPVFQVMQCQIIFVLAQEVPLLTITQGLTNPDGSEYTPPRLWRDVYETISAAQKLIYITGEQHGSEPGRWRTVALRRLECVHGGAAAAGRGGPGRGAQPPRGPAQVLYCTVLY